MCGRPWRSALTALAIVTVMSLAPSMASAQRAGASGGRRARRKSREGKKSKKGKRGASKFFSVRRDYRECTYPFCGGWFVMSVNEESTRCPDGSDGEECYVIDVDFKKLRGADTAEFLSSGTNLAVGRLRSKKFDDGNAAGTFGSLVAEEAWYGAGDEVMFGHPGPGFWRVVDSGIRCITFPCFSLNRELLNLGVASAISGLDLSGVRASEDELDAAFAAIREGNDGLYVAGEDVPDSGPAGEGVTLRATQFFLPLAKGKKSGKKKKMSKHSG